MYLPRLGLGQSTCVVLAVKLCCVVVCACVTIKSRKIPGSTLQYIMATSVNFDFGVKGAF